MPLEGSVAKNDNDDGDANKNADADDDGDDEGEGDGGSKAFDALIAHQAADAAAERLLPDVASLQKVRSLSLSSISRHSLLSFRRRAWRVSSRFVGLRVAPDLSARCCSPRTGATCLLGTPVRTPRSIAEFSQVLIVAVVLCSVALGDVPTMCAAMREYRSPVRVPF